MYKKVFISGVMVTDELTEEREIVACTLERMGFEPIYFRSLPSRGGINIDETYRLIKNSDIFVILLAERMTYWVNAEFLYAQQCSIPIFAFLKSNAVYDKSLIDFINRNNLNYIPFIDKNDLVEQLRIALSDSERMLKYPKIHIDKMEITTAKIIQIENPTAEWVTIGIVQIDFDLTRKFPFENKHFSETAQKIFKFLEIATQQKLDFLLLPELSVNANIVFQIEQFCSKDINCSNVIIIAGSYYHNSRNICPIIFKNFKYYVPKIHPSKFEDSPIVSERMISGNHPSIFITEKGRFAILICDDFRHEWRRMPEYVDMIFIPSFNQKPENFRHRASIYVEDYHKYIFISNVAKYGFSGVYGVMDEFYLERLHKNRFTPSDHPPYELCSLPPKFEGMLVVQCNLLHRGIIKPTPVKDMYANIRDIRLIDISGSVITQGWW